MIARSTKQRKLVLELMMESLQHRTADEVYELARAKNPRISRGTVYRNLNLLVEERLLKRLTLDSGAHFFDPVRRNHYHFYCRKCKKVTNAPLMYLSQMDELAPELSGYKIEGHSLLITGLCPNCSETP